MRVGRLCVSLVVCCLSVALAATGQRCQVPRRRECPWLCLDPPGVWAYCGTLIELFKVCASLCILDVHARGRELEPEVEPCRFEGWVYPVERC
jgi:hypothetical protein